MWSLDLGCGGAVFISWFTPWRQCWLQAQVVFILVSVFLLKNWLINSCESPSNQTGLIVWIIPCAFVSLAPLAVASALCRLELKTEFLCSLLAVRSVLMLVGFGCCFLFLFLVFRYSVPFDNMLLGKSYLGTIFLIGLYFALT